MIWVAFWNITIGFQCDHRHMAKMETQINVAMVASKIAQTNAEVSSLQSDMGRKDTKIRCLPNTSI